MSGLFRRETWWRARPGAGSRGRILAVKWGYNPNSSSLGVDVTFLLFGMLAVVLLTPLVGLVLRARGLLGAASQQSVTPPHPAGGPTGAAPGGPAGDARG